MSPIRCWARFPKTGTLPPMTSYTGMLTAPLPGVAPGSYYVILRTNIRDTIPETTLSNNLSASLTQTSIDATALTLGHAGTAQLNEGQSAYYKVTVTAGQTLQVSLTNQPSAAYNELYVSFGTMPTRSQIRFPLQPAVHGRSADYRAQYERGDLLYPGLRGHGSRCPENYTLERGARSILDPGCHARLRSVHGPVTLQINGAQFAFDTTFQLQNSCWIGRRHSDSACATVPRPSSPST